MRYADFVQVKGGFFVKLMYLAFGVSPGSVQSLGTAPKGVAVSPDNKTWEWGGSTFKVGEGRPLGSDRTGIIGVYNIDRRSHVNSMVATTLESQRDTGCGVLSVRFK